MAEVKPKILVEYAEEATIVTLADERILAEEDIQALREAIMSIIEQAGRISMILDFRNVRFLSSAVLGLLIRVSKKIYESGGVLKLCNIDKKILEVFRITRLNKIFDIHRDLESALGSFSSSD
ncbi:MAG: STAS domain-containing protein [Planctomycetota bacterium]|jgi:anti-sigma B factor antagonist